jgi:hypothetical protein
LLLADYSTVTLDPGTCWLDDEGADVVLTWNSGRDEDSADVKAEVISQHLDRRNIVFTSW